MAVAARAKGARALPWLAGALLLAAVSCGSAAFDGHVYRAEDTVFRVGPVPLSWRRIDVSDAALAFRNDAAAATVAVNARCGKDAADVPLPSLTRHLFIYFREREVHDEKYVPMDGREALRTEMTAQLDGVRKSFVVYVLKKDECVYDFLYISRPDTLATGIGDFERFVAGFGTLAD